MHLYLTALLNYIAREECTYDLYNYTYVLYISNTYVLKRNRPVSSLMTNHL